MSTEGALSPAWEVEGRGGLGGGGGPLVGREGVQTLRDHLRAQQKPLACWKGTSEATSGWWGQLSQQLLLDWLPQAQVLLEISDTQTPSFPEDVL